MIQENRRNVSAEALDGAVDGSPSIIQENKVERRHGTAFKDGLFKSPA